MKPVIIAVFAASALGSATQVVRASVEVHGEATSSGPAIQVQVFANITSPAVMSHSFKLYYPGGELSVASATLNSALWYFHDGTRIVPAQAPDASTTGEVLFVGGHMDARNPLSGVTGNRVLLGTVVFNRTSADVPAFNLSIGRAGQFASFVTIGGAVLEAQPGAVTWQGVASDPADGDLDGLSDRWEESYFGTTKGVFYSDDGDRDGVSNLGEEAMGSDPKDPRSLLQLSLRNNKDALVLEWPSADGRRYTLEGAKTLGRFEVLQEGIAATPPRNTVELKSGDLGATLFLRVRVEAVEQR
jgi:hypothetical protein